MLSFLIVLLSIILVLNSFFLGLLVLVQLPKKEAGAGMAFGASTGEALFGAGSGTMLTKLTKYSSCFFLGLCLLISMMIIHQHNQERSGLEQQLEKQTTPQQPGGATLPALPSNALAAPSAAVSTNQDQGLLKPATNAAQPLQLPSLKAPGATNKSK